MSNIGKYQSGNPIKQALLRRFLERTQSIVPSSGTILDVGTGEGLYWEEMSRGQVVGIDIREDALRTASDNAGVLPVLASAGHLPFPDKSFDFAIAIEIFEHLPEPSNAADEIARISRRGGLITVPWEPWFSLMVLFGTGQYIRRLGREPEHIQAFGPADLQRLLRRSFGEVEVETCLPWLIASVSH